MRFLPTEEPVAQGLPGAAVHQEAAEHLLPKVESLM